MERYRTEKRKANVGERILITSKYDWEHRYKNGSVGEVLGLDVTSVFVKFDGVNVGVDHCEYEVIEGENEMESKRLTDYSYEELLEAIKSKAQAEVKPKTQVEIAGESMRKVLERMGPTLQEKRDQIVEQAKRDVAERINKYGEMYQTIGRYENQCITPKFFVNKEKRAVTVLLYGKFSKNLYAKGIAKCDPSDCFNAHIGKAIALRRALGLEVPVEYLNVPQPTEVRVGDLIYDKFYNMSGKVYAINPEKRTYGEDIDFYFGKETGWLTYIDPNDYERRIEQHNVQVIDDTREGV